MMYGIALFLIGLALFTIGGFITMIRHPQLQNNEARAMLDPVRRDIPKDARVAFDRTMLRDPKAKWFSRIGLALCFAGMAVFAYLSPAEKDADTVDKTGVTKQIVTKQIKTN